MTINSLVITSHSLAPCKAIFVCLLLPACANAQGSAPTVEKIVETWKQTQQAAQAIRCKAHGTCVLPSGALDDAETQRAPNAPASPAADVSWEFRREVLLDPQAGRYRIEEEDKEYFAGDGRLYPKYVIRTFDGKLIKKYRPRELNTHPLLQPGPTDFELGVGTGFVGGAPIEMNLWPLFYALGSVPTVSSPLTAAQLRVLPSPELYYVQGEAVYKGRRCLVLRSRVIRTSSIFGEFWIDPTRQCAILRYVVYQNKVPTLELSIGYQQQAVGWFPKEWTLTQRHPLGGRTLRVETTVIDSVSVDPAPSPEEFDIAEKPGMRVREYDHPVPAGHGPIGPSPSTLYLIDEHGDWVLLEGPAPPSWRRLLGLVLSVVCVIALVGLCARWVRRRTAFGLFSQRNR